MELDINLKEYLEKDLEVHYLLNDLNHVYKGVLNASEEGSFIIGNDMILSGNKREGFYLADKDAKTLPGCNCPVTEIKDERGKTIFKTDEIKPGYHLFLSIFSCEEVF